MLSFYKIYIFEELDYIIIDLKPSVVSEWLMADEIVQSLMLGTAVFYFMFFVRCVENSTYLMSIKQQIFNN